MSEIRIVRNPDDDELRRLGVFGWPTWECEPSSFPWTYDAEETCYILEGEVTVTPDGGEPVAIAAGDPGPVHTNSNVAAAAPNGWMPRREPRGLATSNKRRATKAGAISGRGPLGKAPDFARYGVIPRGCATSTSRSECLAPHRIRRLRQRWNLCEQALVTFPAGMRCRWDVRAPIRKHYRFG